MATIPGLRTYDPTATSAAASSGGTNVQSSADLSQNFLRMLTVQLQNQDPLNPMDNAAMTAQLAQLNMVDGIGKLNSSVASMMAVLRDDKGQQVDRVDLGAASSGVTNFIWDGKDAQGQSVAEGRYQLELLALDAKGDALDAKSYVSAMVADIGFEDGVMKLGLHDGRNITADDIYKWVAV